jgi:hypothetical protein
MRRRIEQGAGNREQGIESRSGCRGKFLHFLEMPIKKGELLRV